MNKNAGAGWGHALRQPLFLAVGGTVAAATVLAGVILVANTTSAASPTSPLSGSQTSASTTGVQPAPKAQPKPTTSPNNNGSGVGNGNGNDKKTILLSGEVVGLYPGATKTLTLAAGNLNNFTVRLYQLTADVGTPVTTGGTTPKVECLGSVLVVTPQALPVNIPQSGGSVTASVHMLPTATNDCRNATFPIRFTGKVDKP